MLSRISDFTAATLPLAGTEMLEVETAGGDARFVTAQDIADLAGGAINLAVTALSISSGAVTIDLSLGSLFTLALTENVTAITVINAPGAGLGRSIDIRFRQDATGSRTVALPASFKATGGSDTAVASAANAYTVLSATTFDAGTRWEYAMQEGAA